MGEAAAAVSAGAQEGAPASGGCVCSAMGLQGGVQGGGQRSCSGADDDGGLGAGDLAAVGEAAVPGQADGEQDGPLSAKHGTLVTASRDGSIAVWHIFPP